MWLIPFWITLLVPSLIDVHILSELSRHLDDIGNSSCFILWLYDHPELNRTETYRPDFTKVSDLDVDRKLVDILSRELHELYRLDLPWHTALLNNTCELETNEDLQIELWLKRQPKQNWWAPDRLWWVPIFRVRWCLHWEHLEPIDVWVQCALSWDA